MTAVSRSHRLACLGGQPAFAEPLPVGQMYFPSWERYENAMRGVFERGWYTNHGPLARELESRLAAFFGVEHAVVVSNATVGLLMTIRCLDLHGSVIVPGFTFVASAQAVTWAGLEVRFCDVDPKTHQVTTETLSDAFDDDVAAILAVNLWGGTCDPPAIDQFARRHGVSLVFDSAHGVGVRSNGVPLGGFGDAEVFSFHATKILSATEGGCVCTNDGELAARLRNMRSSYGAGPPTSVPLTSNGRFSEAQAAIALMSLEDFELNREHNERIHRCYERGLEDLPGVRLYQPVNADLSNFQYAVVEIDADRAGLGRNAVLAALRAEGVVARRYFYPGVHRTPPYLDGGVPQLPATDGLCDRLLQVPVGALVSEEAAGTVCELLRGICADPVAVRAAVAPER